MPKKQLGGLPFPPLIRLDTSDPITADKLTEILRSHPRGVSLCVRSATGHPNRGGYFFHIRPKDNALAECEVFDFEGKAILSLSLLRLTAFVNHCAGLAFDEETFQLCQSVVNFRLDPERDAGQDA